MALSAVETLVVNIQAVYAEKVGTSVPWLFERAGASGKTFYRWYPKKGVIEDASRMGDLCTKKHTAIVECVAPTYQECEVLHNNALRILADPYRMEFGSWTQSPVTALSDGVAISQEVTYYDPVEKALQPVARCLGADISGIEFVVTLA